MLIEFLRLGQANDATVCEEEEIMVSRPDEIKAAQPLTEVLPRDVLREVLAIAGMLSSDDSSIQ